MDLVTAPDVGVVALDRMLRERVVAPVGPGVASPLDLPITAADRAAAIARAVPAHTVVSALAGLWIHAGGHRPTALDLVGVAGLHRPPPGTSLEGWRLVFHSGPASREPWLGFGGVKVSHPARCVADALRWDCLEEAFPAVMRALSMEAVDVSGVAAVVAATEPRGRGAGRMRSAWEAIEATLSQPPGASGNSR